MLCSAPLSILSYSLTIAAYVMLCALIHTFLLPDDHFPYFLMKLLHVSVEVPIETWSDCGGIYRDMARTAEVPTETWLNCGCIYRDTVRTADQAFNDFWIK